MASASLAGSMPIRKGAQIEGLKAFRQTIRGDEDHDTIASEEV